MWFLVMVFFTITPGFDRVYVLEKYTTYEECYVERARVGFAMAEAYPYDRDFVIECQFRGEKA